MIDTTHIDAILDAEIARRLAELDALPPTSPKRPQLCLDLSALTEPIRLRAKLDDVISHLGTPPPNVLELCSAIEAAGCAVRDAVDRARHEHRDLAGPISPEHEAKLEQADEPA